MTEGDREKSGELTSFLHLTGWRPLVLALVAGLAGAVGLFLALRAPVEYQARYTMNASRIADDDFTPAQLDIFAEEIASTAKFPQVAIAVEDRTGLVIEDDYEINVGQSGATLANIDANVVAGDPGNAQQVAIETLIEAMTITMNKTLGGHEAAARQVRESLVEVEASITDLTEQAGGLNPQTAYDRAVQNVFDAEDAVPLTTFDADGNPVVGDVPTQAEIDELKVEVNRLEPLNREYRNRIAAQDALNLRLADQNNNIRDAQAALALIETEREDQIIIDEVETEETSRIAGLLSGLLMFAVPAALLMIFVFVVFDALRKKPEPLAEAEEFEAAGMLDATSTPALPQGSRNLVVVDEEDEATPPPLGNDILAEDELDEDVDDAGDDEPEPKSKKRSKDGRWGRDASSKAG